MSWPRRHELIDVDLDAYAEDADAPPSDVAQPAIEEPRVSLLEAAERAGIPLEELLHRLSW